MTVLTSLRSSYFASAVWAVGMSGVLLFLGAQLNEVFGVGSVGIGGVVAMTGVLGFGTTLAVSRLDDRRRADLLVPVLVASGLLAMAYIASPSLWLAVFFVGLWSVAYWAGFAIAQAVIAANAGRDQAAALTFFQTPWSFGLALGPAVVGLLVDRSGFVMIGLVGLSAALWSSWLFRRG